MVQQLRMHTFENLNRFQSIFVYWTDDCMQCNVLTHVRCYVSDTCVLQLVQIIRGKDVSCSNSNTIPRDEFFKINVLSAVSVSSTIIVWYASLTHLFADRSVTVADARIANICRYFCLARRHVCPVSGIFC